MYRMFSDLIEDFNFPDLFTDEPITPSITQADEEIIKMLPAELKALNDRITQLETALSTQTLKLELERAKRQKLGAIMKQRRPETPMIYPDALKRLIETNFMHQETVNYQLGDGIDRLSTVSFRCLSRVQQLMSYIIPCIAVTPSDHPDVTILLEEIGRSLQQLCIPQPANTHI